MAVVGIDLGTTNTVIACARGGRVQVLADDVNRHLLPSVVSFHPSGEVLVGYPARERRLVDAKNTIASVKRLIGRAWDSEEIKKARPRFAFELKEGLGQGPLVAVRDQTYTLPEISAFVLRRAKQIADAALLEPVDRAVVTVPASFNELQRAATKVAGRIAGLDVMRIINEPTAAALAYGFGRNSKERVAVYDFGGGTFDCTLLELSGNVFEVLATAGDSFLGGDDIDLAIAERMSDAFLVKHRWDPRAYPQVFERLRATAEHIKIELSTKERARTLLREVGGVGGSSLDLEFSMTRMDLDFLANALVEQTFAVCEDALSVAGLTVSSFDKVILVGGSTRIPLVRRRVEEFFGSQPLDRVNPEEVVAIGAAIQAAALVDAARRRSIPPPPRPGVRRAPSIPPTDDEVTIASPVSHVIAQSPQSRPPGGKPPSAAPAAARRAPPAPSAKPPPPPPIPRSSLVPTAPTPAKVPSSYPPPAKGPASQPGPPSPRSPSSHASPPSSRSPSSPRADGIVPIVDEETESARFESAAPAKSPSGSPGPATVAPVLVDVTPRALVVETAGGFTDVVVPRNAKIPCERTRAFTTSSDMQTMVHVRVAQGEDATFNSNTFLGELELDGLRAGPRGTVTIQVRFEVDEGGSLKVFATDVGTGKQAQAHLQLIGIAGAQGVAVMQARQAGMVVS
jgi:molecular chaperone DnaK